MFTPFCYQFCRQTLSCPFRLHDKQHLNCSLFYFWRTGAPASLTGALTSGSGNEMGCQIRRAVTYAALATRGNPQIFTEGRPHRVVRRSHSQPTQPRLLATPPRP